MCDENPVVIVGASGFIGRRVERALAAVDIATRPASRRPTHPHHRSIDITGDVDSLVRLVDGARAVIHAASYTGSDTDRSWGVNAAGTAQLAAACAAAGVDRLVYVSTTAVYGRGPHRGTTVTGASLAPTSPVSTDRMHAEHIVLAHGGIIIRPNLLLGAGDRWVLGSLARLLRNIDALPEDAQRRRLSVLHVDAAGQLIAATATAQAIPPGSQMIAAPEDPITVADLCRLALTAHGVVVPRRTLPPEKIRDLARSAGYTEHQIDMVFSDHFFDPGAAWTQARIAPPSQLTLTASDIAWYRHEAAR